jgi:Methyltransferase domain
MKGLLARMIDYDDKNSLGFRLRAKRIRPLLELVAELHARHGCVRLVDIGGTRTYWKIVPEDVFKKYQLHVTIINLSNTLGDSASEHFDFIEGDGCNLSMLPDKSFHIAHSNSVIEHVGSWVNMKSFANEIRRISECYYVQTPNFWFPVEPHSMSIFSHWLPLNVRIRLLQTRHVGRWRKVDSIDAAMSTFDRIFLLDKHMFRYLFGDATVVFEKFFFFNKSWIAIKKE